MKIKDKFNLGDEVARHAVFSLELLLSSNFHLRAGYDHQRRKELTIPGRGGLVGYSMGGGFRVNRFHISYGRSWYHISSASNTITLSTDLASF